MTAEYTPEQTPPRQCPECGGLFGHTENCVYRVDGRTAVLAAALAAAREHEHLWLSDVRGRSDAEVQLRVNGRLVSGTWGTQVTSSIDAMLTAAILTALSPTAAEQVSAALAVADKAAADTARALGDT